MFVVCGFLAAWRVRVPCVVVTTTVRGRDGLAAKVRLTDCRPPSRCLAPPLALALD